MEEAIQWTELERTLREYGQEVVNAYKQSLRDHKRVATSELIDSVAFEIDKGGTWISVSIRLAEYWKYVEWDTKPHWPPAGCLLRWIEAKPIAPRPMANGKLPTPMQLDYLIRRKISEEGTRGSHDLENTIDALNDVWSARIEEAAVRDIDRTLDIYITRLF